MLSIISAKNRIFAHIQPITFIFPISSSAYFMYPVPYMRNIIAHHSRIWSRNMVKRPCEIHNPRMTWLSRPLTEVQQKKPFYVITAMLYLCNAIDEGHTFKEKLLALFEEYADVPIYKIGFFNRWKEEPIWK